MSPSSSQRLRLSLLGYRRTQVEVALAELRLMVRHLQEDVTESRERARQMEDALREARIELDSRRARETEVTQAFEAAQERVREVEAAAEMTARAILAEAEEKASRTRAEAHLRTESVSGQVDELLRLRDTLVQTMRGVISDFDYAVGRVEKGESVLPAEPTAPSPPEPAANGNGNGHANGNGNGNGNGAPHVARARGPEDEQSFEGRVELDAGPFGDFAGGPPSSGLPPRSQRGRALGGRCCAMSACVNDCPDVHCVTLSGHAHAVEPPAHHAALYDDRVGVDLI